MNVELTEFKLALVQLLYDKSVDVPISLLHNADQRLLIAGSNDTADDAAHRIKYRGRSLGSPDINAGFSPIIEPRAPLRQFEHRNKLLQVLVGVDLSCRKHAEVHEFEVVVHLVAAEEFLVICNAVTAGERHLLEMLHQLQQTILLRELQKNFLVHQVALVQHVLLLQLPQLIDQLLADRFRFLLVILNVLLSFSDYVG